MNLTLTELRCLRKLKQEKQTIPSDKTDEPGYCGLIEQGLADFTTLPQGRYCWVWITEAGLDRAKDKAS